MTRVRWYGPTLVLVVALLLVMLIGPQLVQRLEWYRTGEQISLARNGNLENLSLAELSEAFRNVARGVGPSVVHIQVEGKLPPRSQLGLEFDERLRRRFLLPERDQEEPGRDEPELRQYDVPHVLGNASGWVYDDQGHIITNNHVVEHGQKITVKFANKSVRVAQVVGKDRFTDIAVLKVEGGDLHPVPLASRTVEQGEIVFAFGSPFGYEFSMSQGIVSAKGRQIDILRPRGGYEDFIQTDASINRGNSGGPLTNIFGEVVGMNTAIATRGNPDANFNGMGFAIPARMIRHVVEDLISEGKVVRGYLGVEITELKEDMAYTFGYEGQGVLVHSPQAGFPAADAGVQSNDIIMKVDGDPVQSTKELQDLIALCRPGQTVELEIYRGKEPDDPGETVTIPVTIVAKPDKTLASGSPREPDEPQEPQSGSETMQALAKLGLERIETATPEQFQRLYVPGVVVITVRPNSAAHGAGVRRGHIITGVFGTPVTNTDELVAELTRHDMTRPIRVRVHDGESDSAVVLVLPDGEQ